MIRRACLPFLALFVSLSCILAVPGIAEGKKIGLFGTTDDHNPSQALTELLTGNGHIVVDYRLNASVLQSPPYDHLDVAILLRADPTRAHSLHESMGSFVLSGGVLITEWDGAVGALNTAKLLDAEDGGTLSYDPPDRTAISFTHRGGALANSLTLPYSDNFDAGSVGSNRTANFRSLKSIGPEVAILATVSGEYFSGDKWFPHSGLVPAIIAGRSGDGLVLVIATHWYDFFHTTNTDTRQLILNAVNLEPEALDESIPPEPVRDSGEIIISPGRPTDADEVELTISGNFRYGINAVESHSHSIEDTLVRVDISTKWTADVGPAALTPWSIAEALSPLPLGHYGVDVRVNGEAFLLSRFQVYEPLWLPKKPGKIAFTSERDGNQEIYVMHAFGSEPVNLTNHPANDSDPSWSPDGSKIAFLSNRDGPWNAFLMNSDGTEVRKISDHKGGQIAWSPDGQEIGINTDSGFAAVDLMGGLRWITGPDKQNLSWSPDGSKMVYETEIDGNWEIYVMNADGSDPVNLTNLSSAERYPIWSPDGSRIAFTATISGRGFEIYTMDSDGGNIVQLTSNLREDQRPAWSPDGEKLAYTKVYGNNRDIYVMNVDGSAHVRLTLDPGADLQPSWSPVSRDALWDSDIPESARPPQPIFDLAEIHVVRLDSNKAVINLSGEFPWSGARVVDHSHILAGSKIIFRITTGWDGSIGEPTRAPWAVEEVIEGVSEGEYRMAAHANGLEFLSGPLRVGTEPSVPVPPDSSSPGTTDPPASVPDIEIFPEAIDFGQVRLGRVTSADLFISNVGAATLRTINMVSSSLDVSVSETGFSLETGEEKKVTLTFQPTTVGNFTEALSIPSNDPDESTLHVPLLATIVAGTGAPAIGSSITDLDFGAVPIGEKAELLLPISNDGTASLIVFNAVSDNVQISISPSSLNVPPGETRSLNVSYTPLPGRDRTGQITLDSNDQVRPKFRLDWSADEVESSFLEITRIDPETGATGIDLETVLSISFSEPIYQRGRFVDLDVELMPQPVSGPLMGKFELRGDGRSVTFPVTLEENRSYRLIVFGGSGTSGSTLFDPFETRFSTGDVIPSSVSISGRVATVPVIPFNGFVLLFDSNHRLVAKEPLGADGSYRTGGSPAGGYFVYAEIETGEGERFEAFLDGDGDGLPDEILADHDLTDIDIVVDAAPSVGPAGDNSDAILSLDLDPGTGDQGLRERSVSSGEEFSVSVYVDGISELTGYTVEVRFDPDQVELVSAREEAVGEGVNLLKQTGGAPIYIRSPLREDRIKLGGALLAPTPGVAAGSKGLVSTFSFVAKDEFTGETSIVLSEAVLRSFGEADTLRLDMVASVSIEEVVPLPDEDVEEGPVSLDFDLADGDQGQRAAGNAEPGKVYDLQINVTDAPEISGWSTTVEYDPTQVRYVSGSFEASGFIPGLVALVDEKESSVGVGGTVLGTDASNSGTGSLGSLSFEILEGFSDSTELVITALTLRRTDGTTEKPEVRAAARISSRAVVAGLPGDFDGSGAVDFDDFFLFADGFGSTDSTFDLNGDGEVGFDDFFIFADNFGKGARAKLMVLARKYLGLPSTPRLEQNYPNPFNASTTIRYRVAEPSPVRLDVFDLSGQRIRTLVSDFQGPGSYEVSWDGTDERGARASTGVYLLRLRSGGSVDVGKVLLVK